MKKILFILGIIVLLNFQYSIFLNNNNIFDYFYLHNINTVTVNDINQLKNKNQQLENEIRELKKSPHALENFARYNLGLIKEDEIFIQILNNEK